MADRSGKEFLPWSAAGVVLLAALVAVFWLIRPDEGPAQQLASKASRVDAVSRMQVALASSAEAQRSAVMTTSDEDSAAFAAQARAGLAEVERARDLLVPLLARPDLARERELLQRFSEGFARLERLDEEILGLAVRNTNVKVYALAYGPATALLEELDAALARVAGRRAGGPEALATSRETGAARLAALRLRALLPPHIAEERAEEMDRLEAAMDAEQRRGGQALDRLAARPALAADPDLALARARFTAFLDLKGRILALSRENTNVASLALTLHQQRKALVTCAGALDALQQAIQEEPIAGVSYGRQPGPTR